MLNGMDPVHTTIEEFATDGYTHIQCYCPRCRAMRLRPISWLPRISMGLTNSAGFSAAYAWGVQEGEYSTSTPKLSNVALSPWRSQLATLGTGTLASRFHGVHRFHRSQWRPALRSIARRSR